MRPTFTAAMILAGAAALGIFAGVAPELFRRSHDAHPADAPGLPALPRCNVVDGDTLRCGSERIRLLGIDAPELPGHCTRGRVCAPGDPVASTASLRDALEPPLRINRVGTDRYGRTLALVAGAKGGLSCWQLEHRQAIYKPHWDDGGRLAAICSEAR